jgi:chromate transporter
MPEPEIDGYRPSLWQLLRSFGTIGVTSMGGGRFAFFYHEFARRRHWLTDSELLDGLALSQVLPGPNIGNLSVLLGARLRGARGGAIALVAVLAPGATLMLVLSALYFGSGQVPALLPVFKGIAAAASGLALTTSLQVAWKGVRSLRALALAAVTLVGVGVFRVPTVPAILVMTGVGLVLFQFGPPSAPAAAPRKVID